MPRGRRIGLAWLVLLLGSYLPATAVPRELALDSQRSSIEVQVHATLDQFAGRLKKFRSIILVDPATQTIEQAEFSFSFSDLKTGIERRDRDMLAWQGSEKFPEVLFRLTGLAPTTAGPVQVRGNLTMHGVEREVTFPVSFLVEGPLYSIDGELQVDYRDFGLPLIRRFYFLTVDPRLRIRFHLQGRLAETPL